MEERINKLIKKGFFKEAKIDSKGFGTFTDQQESDKNMHSAYLKMASTIKREADAKYKIDNKKGIKLYLNSVIYYTKGYRLGEKHIGNDKSIGYYKGLCKYFTEISQMKCGVLEYKEFMTKALISIRFHFLGLETASRKTDLAKDVYDLYTLWKKSGDFLSIDNLDELFYKIDFYMT